MPVRTSVRAGVTGTAMLAVFVLAGCAADPPAAVVGLTVTGCPPIDAHGSGVVVAPGLVMTSAHVVKGAEGIAVTNGKRTATARVVAFDPEMDLALVRVSTGLAKPVAIADDADDEVEPGQRGVAYVFRDGVPEMLPVRVRRPVRIHTEDIYIEGDTYRPGFELDADIRAGDSGGPVMVDGAVIGVLWARSSTFESRAYAIDPVDAGATIREQLRTGVIAPEIDLTRC